MLCGSHEYSTVPLHMQKHMCSHFCLRACAAVLSACTFVWDSLCMYVCFHRFQLPMYEKHGSTYNFHLYVGRQTKRHTEKETFCSMFSGACIIIESLQSHQSPHTVQTIRAREKSMYVCVRTPETERARHLIEY